MVMNSQRVFFFFLFRTHINIIYIIFIHWAKGEKFYFSHFIGGVALWWSKLCIFFFFSVPFPTVWITGFHTSPLPRIGFKTQPRGKIHHLPMGGHSISLTACHMFLQFLILSLIALGNIAFILLRANVYI